MTLKSILKYKILVFLIVLVLLIIFIDRRLAQYFHDSVTQTQYLFWNSITQVGDALYVLIGAVIMMGFYKFNRYIFNAGYFLFASVAVSGIITDILKVFIGRSRPKLFLENNIYTLEPFSDVIAYYWSMPSGHTTTVFATVSVFSILYPKHKYSLFAIAIIVALSRVVIQKHYLSDIVVGAIIGSISTTILYKRYFAKTF